MPTLPSDITPATLRAQSAYGRLDKPALTAAFTAILDKNPGWAHATSFAAVRDALDPGISVNHCVLLALHQAHMFGLGAAWGVSEERDLMLAAAAFLLEDSVQLTW